MILHFKCESSIHKIVDSMSEKVEVTPHPTHHKVPLLIRWGHIGPQQSSIVFNPATSIEENAACKSKARILMRKAGVKCPLTLTHENMRGHSLGGRWVSRPPYHSRGVDFKVINNNPKLARRHLLEGRYLSRIFPKTHEFRIHCGHGRVLAVQNKHCGNALNSSTMWTTAAWTCLNIREYRLAMCKDALMAIECLGLDFGAVDVVWNSKTRKYAVLEVNTGPSLPGQITPRKYANYFDWLIRTKKIDHFSFSGARRIADIVWRMKYA